MAASRSRRIACRRPLYNTRGERGSRGKSKVSPVLHVHGFHPKAKHIPTGWQSTLCNADTVSNAVRISTDVYGCVRRRGTWCSVCHVLLYFCSAWLTESQSPTPYSSVPVRTSPYYSARTLRSAQSAPPPWLRHVCRSGPESSVKWQISTDKCCNFRKCV